MYYGGFVYSQMLASLCCSLCFALALLTQWEGIQRERKGKEKKRKEKKRKEKKRKEKKRKEKKRKEERAADCLELSDPAVSHSQLGGLAAPADPVPGCYVI
jgi:flagellar biosynthesis component FlhA